MPSLLTRLLHGLIRWSPWIALGVAAFPILVVLPLTWQAIAAHSCDVTDFQIIRCESADEATLQSLNNGLVFSLWGLLLTIPTGIAIQFGSLWAKHMIELYYPVKKGDIRPPLYPGEPPRSW